MKFIDFTAGFLTGYLWKKGQQKIHNKNEEKNDEENRSPPQNKSNKKMIKKRYSKKFKIKNPTGKPITADDFTVSINKNKSPSSSSQQKSENRENTNKKTEPNFIPLTIFWAHFQANEKGLLKENKPLPWEIHKEENEYKKEKWLNFLNQIIDKDWPHWINDSTEVKNRSLSILNKLEE